MTFSNPKDRLVRQYLAKARRANHAAQSYGGSTGGRKSIDDGSGINVLNRRSAEQAEQSQIFRDSLDEYGAKREAWEARRDLGT